MQHFQIGKKAVCITGDNWYLVDEEGEPLSNYAPESGETVTVSNIVAYPDGAYLEFVEYQKPDADGTPPQYDATQFVPLKESKAEATEAVRLEYSLN